MTTLTLLSGDFEILFDDETVGTNAVAGMRMVRRASGASSTVYTTNALYSAIADATDEFQAMGFRNPMLPVTPNAYTMENNYFIPRSTTEWLKEGAIDADWSVTATPDTNGNGVVRKPYTVVTNFVTGDIGRQVVESVSTDTGTLLDFEKEPDGQWVAWIRPDDSTPTTGDTFDSTTGTLSVTVDGGTGSNTPATGEGSGQSLWSSIQAIGAVPTATDVYLYQDRVKMTDWEGNYQWWDTDTTVSLGIIDILVRVISAGTTIADGDVEVFSRRYTSLYDNFRLNVVAGGRSALPLASAPDINNTTGYRKTACTGSSGTWTAGNGIYVGASWAAATARGVLTVGGTGTTPTLEYYLVGDLTDLTATTVTEYDFTTALDGDATATAGAPAANDDGPTDATSGEGGTVTIALGTVEADHDGDAVNEPYSVEIDAQSNVPIAKVYERIKYVTRRGATTADLFGAGTNVPGESYRGMDGLFEWDANVGTMTEGDDILTTTGGSTWTARLLSYNATWTDTYITVTDQQTSLDSIVNNDVIEDEAGGDTVTVDSAGTLGIVSVTSPKSSPFGTFTGTQIFGARGIYFSNPHSSDTQAYILTDDLGNLKNPPNTVSFLVSNTLSLDRILVARDTGTAGVIDKDQFGGLAAASGTYNGLGDSVIRAAGTVDTEVPQSGYIRIVATGVQEEHRYVYSSRTTGALGEFTLKAVTEGSGATSTSSTQLIDTSTNFTTNGTEVGMLVRNTTVAHLNQVWEITNIVGATTVDVRALYGSPVEWASTDTYTINTLIGRDHAATPADYGTSDDVFDLILDLEADAVTENNTFVKILTSDFGVVVNARQGKVILPFTQNATVGDSGGSVTVVRTPDTIAV